MKTNGIYVLLAGLLALSGCTIKREVIIPAGNDFSTVIVRNIPQASIDKVRQLGVTVNDGQTPPNLEGIYFCAPFIMTQTSVPNDGKKPNDRFNDLKVKFYNQNNRDLTISADEKGFSTSTGTLSSTSLGPLAYISGRGNLFSIFVLSDTKSATNSSRSKGLNLYSGEITATGIKNFQNSFLLIDNYGDPNGDLIPVNTGRAFYDSDKFSERVSTFRLAAPDSITVPCTTQKSSAFSSSR